KHCHSDHIVTHNRAASIGGTFEERVWICPRVVIATNEGGGNSTGVCADCILEALGDAASEARVLPSPPVAGSQEDRT
ncbi:MAG: hypothetical protein WC551_14250, partial [Patescibacteria group bacterium]